MQQLLTFINTLVFNIMEKNVIILRGVSGSGKSTFASMLARHNNGAVVVTADDYFTDSWGLYKFDASKLGAAHAQCYKRFETALFDPDVNTVIVANTNTSPRDFKNYVDAAEAYGATVTYLVLENRHGNNDVHDVPSEVKERQRHNLKSSIKL
jgi:predicted kinase